MLIAVIINKIIVRARFITVTVSVSILTDSLLVEIHGLSNVFLERDGQVSDCIIAVTKSEFTSQFRNFVSVFVLPVT